MLVYLVLQSLLFCLVSCKLYPFIEFGNNPENFPNVYIHQSNRQEFDEWQDIEKSNQTLGWNSSQYIGPFYNRSEGIQYREGFSFMTEDNNQVMYGIRGTFNLLIINPRQGVRATADNLSMNIFRNNIPITDIRMTFIETIRQDNSRKAHYLADKYLIEFYVPGNMIAQYDRKFQLTVYNQDVSESWAANKFVSTIGLCPYDCNSCQRENTCSSCPQNAILVQGRCQCAPGFTIGNYFEKNQYNLERCVPVEDFDRLIKTGLLKPYELQAAKSYIKNSFTMVDLQIEYDYETRDIKWINLFGKIIYSGVVVEDFGPNILNEIRICLGNAFSSIDCKGQKDIFQRNTYFSWTDIGKKFEIKISYEMFRNYSEQMVNIQYYLGRARIRTGCFIIRKFVDQETGQQDFKVFLQDNSISVMLDSYHSQSVAAQSYLCEESNCQNIKKKYSFYISNVNFIKVFVTDPSDQGTLLIDEISYTEKNSNIKRMAVVVKQINSGIMKNEIIVGFIMNSFIDIQSIVSLSIKAQYIAEVDPIQKLLGIEPVEELPTLQKRNIRLSYDNPSSEEEWS